MNKLSFFYKTVLAKFSGDTAAATALYNYKTATSLLKLQNAELTHQITKAENQIEKEEQKLIDIKYPSTKMTEFDETNYLQNIRHQELNVQKAKDHLENLKLNIERNEKLLDEFDAQVEA